MSVVPTSDTLVAFCAATVVFVAIPGPNLMFIVSHAISGGRRQGIAAAVGVEIGTLVHIAAAVAGLSALLARSAVLYGMLRYVGIAYLVVLGCRAIRFPGLPEPAHGHRHDAARPLLRGVAVNVLNPKAALFFLAFFPQFMDPGRSLALQALVLGLLLFGIALVVDLAYAVTAASIGSRLSSARRRSMMLHRATAATYLSLAVLSLVTSHRPAQT